MMVIARVLGWWRRRRHRAAAVRAQAARERLTARRRATVASWSTSDGSRISTTPRPLTRAELEARPDAKPTRLLDRRREPLPW